MLSETFDREAFRKKMRARTMKEANNITGQMMDDILCAAMEGGSNYWCYKAERIGKTIGCEYASESISRGGRLMFYDGEADRTMKYTHVLTRAKLARGIEAAAVFKGLTIEKYYEDHDGPDADMALQFALFDELIYG